MQKFSSVIVCLLISAMIFALPAYGEKVTTKWEGDGNKIYDTGFMHMLMKHPGGGASLFNMELIENDSPGAGYSEKGVSYDCVWGKVRARKILNIEDQRAKKAYLVAWYSRQGKYPLQFTVNGKKTQVDNWDRNKCHLSFRWTEFPVKWLKKGENTIELYCPEAQSEGEGWAFYLARADEFEHGGGDPKDVGKTSFKSTNSGETWKESPFGPLGQTRAEYTIRISFDRYVESGWLATPVIDLWKGESEKFITPVRILKKMEIAIRSEVPDETSVTYYMRNGVSPSPFSEDWEPYELIGDGAALDITMNDVEMNGRYIQIRADMSTKNPLNTPVIKSVSVDSELLQGFTAHTSVKVSKAENPVIGYPSIDWEWEKPDRPEFKKVRDRENLDGVIADSKTQFEKILKIVEYATVRVPRKYGTPIPDYPGWDALSILERIDKKGSVGMCIQFNNAMLGMCMAYGVNARLVNGMNHEMGEVWSDDFGKWMYVESSYGNHYMYDNETVVPMSLLELHKAYLDYYFPDRSIDWLNDLTSSGNTIKIINEREDKPPLTRSSTTYHPYVALPYEGMQLSPYMRIIPRNNWYEKPYPIPLTHGNTWWPWNNYINWYDDRTPPMRQYTWFTDRKQDMWPDLNLVHVDATSSHHNKFLYLRFETYTPNFCHYEIDENDMGWTKIDGDRWSWVLASGKNTLRVRSVNKFGAKGKPSLFEVNRADVPLEDLKK